MRAQDRGTATNDRGRATGPADRAARPPQAPTWAAGVLALQRLAGNAAVSRAVGVQRHRHSADCGHGPQQPAVQRRSLVHEVLRSPGRPLDGPLESEMSSRFGGADFSGVRVHTDAVAQRSAAEIGASAYTSRNHVVWNGRDKHTLAHELTHVIQQSEGPVSGTDDGGGLRVSDPGDRFERAAEANATRVMSGPAPVQRAAEPHADDHASPVAAPAGDAGAWVQRRAATPARIGFEFQQLNSQVEVKPTDESASDSEADVYDAKAKHYGEESGLWYVVQDGRNLEFVTRPFGSREELVTAMGEIGRVAEYLFKGTTTLQKQNPDDSPEFEVGDVYVTVHQPDGAGQPQVNPDVPLDSLTALHREADDDEGHFKDYYGVNQKYWRAEKTKEEVAANARVARAVDALDEADLVKTFHMRDDPSAEHLGSVRGMLQVIAAAVVHESLFHTKLEKDQPVLLKTHMGKLWKSLVKDGAIGARASVGDLVALLSRLHGALAEDEGTSEDIVTKVMAGKDPVWGSSLRPVDIGAPAQGGDKPTAHRKQVLVELRRVPILAIDQWADFAAQAFDHFVEDPADRYHRDL
ncbi:DUF4157 domain-containing protein [Streptomyces sp. NPDC007264]|uniref:eCIS core domain-containing protein n=1 Tax=Streptomyces sp. NPDC007264 TaxID=3364777 RepID=UPI0036D8AE8E